MLVLKAAPMPSAKTVSIAVHILSKSFKPSSPISTTIVASRCTGIGAVGAGVKGWMDGLFDGARDGAADVV